MKTTMQIKGTIQGEKEENTDKEKQGEMKRGRIRWTHEVLNKGARVNIDARQASIRIHNVDL